MKAVAAIPRPLLPSLTGVPQSGDGLANLIDPIRA
jgi:hypothetical protein